MVRPKVNTWNPLDYRSHFPRLVVEQNAVGVEQIRQTGVECAGCHTQIFSNSRHDFVDCPCGATYVDGGFDYLRVGFQKEMGVVQQVTRLVTPPLPFYFADEPARKAARPRAPRSVKSPSLTNEPDA